MLLLHKCIIIIRDGKWLHLVLDYKTKIGQAVTDLYQNPKALNPQHQMNIFK